MNLDKYQSEAASTAIYPEHTALYYLPMKLCGEAGEVSEKIAKSIRDNTELNYEALAKELGDVLWYVAVLSNHIGYDLSTIAQMNLDKLRDRKERGVLGGSGDNR